MVWGRNIRGEFTTTHLQKDVLIHLYFLFFLYFFFFTPKDRNLFQSSVPVIYLFFIYYFLMFNVYCILYLLYFVKYILYSNLT